MGFITEPLQFLDNSYAVCLGITYCYLPFMVLPIYSALEKIDPVYWEAAYDLGAGLWKTFWKKLLYLYLKQELLLVVFWYLSPQWGVCYS